MRYALHALGHTVFGDGQPLPPTVDENACRSATVPAKACTGDPGKVGAALARCVRSRRLLIVADVRTAGLVAVTRLAPGIFGRILTRLVAISGRRTNPRVERNAFRRSSNGAPS